MAGIAQTLYDRMASDPHQPLKTNIACNLRAMLLMADAIGSGVDRSSLGYCGLFAPMESLYQHPSFCPQMKRSIGTVPSLRSLALKSHGLANDQDKKQILDIATGDYIIRTDPKADYEIEILGRNGAPLIDPRNGKPDEYQLRDFTTEDRWGHHIALTVKNTDSDRISVIDPFMMAGPASLEDWKASQDCPSAVLAVSDIEGDLLLYHRTTEDKSAARTAHTVGLLKGIKDPFGAGRKAIMKPFLDKIQPALVLPGPYNAMFDDDNIEQTKQMYRQMLAPIRALENWKAEMMPAVQDIAPRAAAAQPASPKP